MQSFTMPQKKELFITNLWDAPVIPDWQWPVGMGIFATTADMDRHLNQSFWVKEFTRLSGIGSYYEKHDILFVENTSLAYRLSRLKGWRFSAKIVLIKRSSTDLDINKEINEIASTIKSHLKASAVIFYTSSLPVNEWFEQLIIHLSHNAGFAEAIERIPATSAVLYISKTLNDDTRLSTLLKTLLTDLKEQKFDDTSAIPIRLTDGTVASMKIARAVKYLQKNFDILPYTHEDSTATTIKLLKEAAQLQKKKELAKKTKAIPRKRKKKIALIKSFKKKSRKQGGGGFTLSDLSLDNINTPVYFDLDIDYHIGDVVQERTADLKNEEDSYLLAVFGNPKTKKTEKKFLLPDTTYLLLIKIGKEDPDFLKTPLDTSKEEIFSDPATMEVMIDLEVTLNYLPGILRAQISWHKYGDSNVATFSIQTPADPQLLTARVAAYCGNRFLQEAVLTIEVRTANMPAQLESAFFKIEAALRNQPHGLNSGNAFDAVIVGGKSADAEREMGGRSKGKEHHFRYTPQMKTLVDKIKALLEEAAQSPVLPGDLDTEQNLDILIPLAVLGFKLHKLYLNNMSLDGPMQLINNAGDFLPLDFAYTRQPPLGTARLCAHASEALNKGACQNCLNSIDEEKNFICPFGFWALSQVVERHQYKAMADASQSDYILKTVPDGNRNVLTVLNKSLHGSSGRVDLGSISDLRTTVRKSISKVCKQPLIYAENWAEWAAAIPQNPDSLILIVHIEKGERTDDDSLEIGNDPLDQIQLDHQYIPQPTAGKAPFVILIGCEASNTDQYLFDTISLLFRQGVAIVVSNFTSIIGEQAARIVMQLTELLKQEATIPVSFGEIILKLRQKMMAQGMLAGLSLLAHGDTDWKIKCDV